jgi:hypothetical protein
MMGMALDWTGFAQAIAASALGAPSGLAVSYVLWRFWRRRSRA